MNLNRPTAAIVLIAGLISGAIIVAGFVAIDWTLDTIGLIPFIGAVVVEVICAAISMRSDILGTLRA